MKALCWQGKNSVSVEQVPDPKIISPGDVIIKITSTAICGSDLHLYNGYQPTMQKGDILGHENMGEVIEVGHAVKKLKVGDRIVVPFTICCGQCFFCQKGLWSCCDNTNPNAGMASKVMGHSPAGLFGFSHMLGGYAGGQAEYLRVPRTFFRQVTWRRKTATSSRAIRSPFGAAALSDSSRFKARGCSAPGG